MFELLLLSFPLGGTPFSTFNYLYFFAVSECSVIENFSMVRRCCFVSVITVGYACSRSRVKINEMGASRFYDLWIWGLHDLWRSAVLILLSSPIVLHIISICCWYFLVVVERRVRSDVQTEKVALTCRVRRRAISGEYARRWCSSGCLLSSWELKMIRYAYLTPLICHNAWTLGQNEENHVVWNTDLREIFLD